ncbi:MAG: DUF5915 domain-containing protein, partial [Acidimicrobiales bacterium]
LGGAGLGEAGLREIVAEELNVDEVVVAEAMGEVLSFQLVPNFRLLGPRLGERVKLVAAALAGLDAQGAAAELEGGEPVTVELAGEVVEIGPEELEVRVQGREGFAVSREGTAAVALDLELDDDLRRRGLLRDVVRQVQELRREAGLAVSDRVRLWLSGVDELAGDAGAIASEVLAVQVSFTPGPDGAAASALETAAGAARAWLERA